MDGIHGRFDSFNSGCTQDSKAPFEGFPICSRPLEPLCAAAGEGRVEDLRRSGREGTRARAERDVERQRGARRQQIGCGRVLEASAGIGQALPFG